MGFYEQYKPFRNYMRRFDLLTGLTALWGYSLHLTDGRPLPAGYAAGKPPSVVTPLSHHVHPWDLDILARELILNAGSGGDRDLRRWDHLATAINHVHRLDEAAFMESPNPGDDVLLDLHRMAHRQFPPQTKVDVNATMRSFKIFGHVALEPIVVRELGMTMRQFTLLWMALSGHFLKHWGLSTTQDYSVVGIPKEASAAFLSRIACPIDKLRTETSGRQSYGRDWLYTWNPLQATPLVAFDQDHPDRTVCPIPSYVTRRFLSGVYYDLVNAKGFDNPFGQAFQAYVGEVIAATCPAPRFRTLAEKPYGASGRRMHGADWVLSDGSGHLFIETKTKRLRVDAKTLSDTTVLDKDLVAMAEAVVQNYRNIRDALDGKTQWVPDGLPVYPLVLTLEDWFIFSPRVSQMLEKHVLDLLDHEGLPASIIDEMPYTVASAHEFEIVVQIVAQTGIAAVMAGALKPERWRASLMPFVRDGFKEEMSRLNYRLFAEDVKALAPRKRGTLANRL